MSSKHSKEYSPADEHFNSFSDLLRDKKWDEAFQTIRNHNEVATMVNQIRNTALHGACFRGAPLRIIDVLIGLNPLATKAKNCHGYLPLHRLCCEQADPAVVRRLLEADPSAAKVQTNCGNLALHLAACNKEIPPESFEIILAAYLEGVSVTNNRGELPLHIACCWLLEDDNLCQILSSLMEANPAAVSTPKNSGYPFHIMMESIVYARAYRLNPKSIRGFKIVLNANSDVASTPCPFYNGGLPLHYLLGNPLSTDFSDSMTELVAILVKVLIKAYPGALIFADDNGLAPLHIAVKKWPYDEELAYDEDGELLDNPPPAQELSETHCQLIESLIQANPNSASIPDREGCLALHLACMYWPTNRTNRTNRLTDLLAANPDALQHVDSKGKTPLQYAFERESDAQEFVTGLISVIQEVEHQQFAYTNMAIQGLSLGLAGARKGLNELRERIRSLEEENAQLKKEIEQLRS